MLAFIDLFSISEASAFGAGCIIMIIFIVCKLTSEDKTEEDNPNINDDDLFD